MIESVPQVSPVLVVPGWSDTQRAVESCVRYLVAEGWPEGHVRGLGFRDRFGSNIEHAEEIADAVESLCRATAHDRVAVVAHSMGGLALRRYLIETDARRVHAAVFAGTPHRGTWAAYLAWGGGGREMRPGSVFLRELNARPLPSEVRAVCLRTPLDTRVLPGSSAWLEGAECLMVRLPTHARLLRHRRTLHCIAGFLASTADSARVARYTRPDGARARAAGVSRRHRS